MPELRGENLIRNIFTVLKYLPTNYLSHYKEKNSSFIAEKPDIQTVTKWSKLISPIQELTNTASLIRSLRRAHHQFCGVPEKLQLILE